MLEKYSKKACALAVISVLTSSLSIAAEKVETTENEDEIIFTANRTATLASEVGSQSIVITEKEIQTRQYHTATEALAHQPGVILSQTSPNGPSSLFIRGSHRTKLIIDGVHVFDPMGTDTNFNYGMLGALLDVDRIEVLKGPQSSLYGSSAMGGVVQIFTNNLNKPGTKFRIMAGSHETIQTSATTTGQIGDLRYSLSGLFENTKGIDATTTEIKPKNTYDKDRNKNRQLSGKLNYLLTDNLDIDFAFTYNNRYSEYDNTFNYTNYNDYNKSKLFTGRLALNGQFFEDKLSSTLAYSMMKLDRDNYSGSDTDPNYPWGPLPDYKTHNIFDGKTQTINFDNELAIYDGFDTRFGLAYQKEQGNNESKVKHSQNTKSIYLEQSLDFADRFFNTVGIRYDKNSVFGNKTTYRLTSRYNINEIVSFKGSFGTGFVTPNIYQIYAPTYGNKDLKPETSKGYDLGIELRPTINSTIAFNYFYTSYKNMIAGNVKNNYKYENLDRAKIKGFEIVGSIDINDQLAFSGSYTYLDAKQKKGSVEYERMERRPRHQVTANVTYQPIQNLTLNASGIYYGERKDVKDKTLKSFAVFDIAGSYKINNTFEVDAKIQNVFNKDYEYADGYRERGRSAYVGVNISL